MDVTQGSTLREQVRRKLIDAELPRHEPVRTWAGPGAGQRCAACDQPIPVSEIEYELQFADGIDTLRFHRDCHAAWETERGTAR